MFWYLLNIFLIVITWFWPVYFSDKDGLSFEEFDYRYDSIRKKRTCIVGAVNWTILSGLRAWTIGADTLAYKQNRFDRTMTRSWDSILADFILKYKYNDSIKDPGYPLLEKVFQVFSTNYQLWLVFIALIFMVPMSIWIYKYSTNACMSWILFSTLFYSFFAITGHRQTIATALVVWLGGNYIKKRKLIPFILITLIAITIHASAICFFPFYWLSKIKINKVTMCIYWLAIVTSFIFRNQFLSFLQNIVGYEDYQFIESARAGIFLYLLLTLALIVTIFYRYLSFDENEILQLSVNALYIACVFSSFLLINSACMRIIQYYSLFLMFMLPELSKIFKIGESRAIYTGGICLLMILLLISNNPTYAFCF